jgi:hypothetical protein
MVPTGMRSTMSSPAAPNWSDPRPGLAVARLVAARVAVVDQGVDVAVGLRPHAAATPAVTAIGAAEGDELLAAEARATAAAVAGGDVDRGFIDELHAALLQVGP